MNVITLGQIKIDNITYAYIERYLLFLEIHLLFNFKDNWHENLIISVLSHLCY